MAHLGAERAFPQGSHQQATNKPEGSLQARGWDSVPKWHILRSEKEHREGNPVFSGPHPRGDRHNPGLDSLCEDSAASRSWQHAYPDLRIRPTPGKAMCPMKPLWPAHSRLAGDPGPLDVLGSGIKGERLLILYQHCPHHARIVGPTQIQN